MGRPAGSPNRRDPWDYLGCAVEPRVRLIRVPIWEVTLPDGTKVRKDNKEAVKREIRNFFNECPEGAELTAEPASEGDSDGSQAE